MKIANQKKQKYLLIISIIFIFLTFSVFSAQGERHIKNLNEKQKLSACLNTKTEGETRGCVNDVYGYNVCYDLVQCCRWLGVELNITFRDSFGNFNENNNEVKKYLNICDTDEAKGVRGMELIRHVFRNGIAFADRCDEITDSKNTLKYFGFNKKLKEVCLLSVSKMWNVKNSFIFYYLFAIGLACIVFAVWKKIKQFFFNCAIKGFLSGTMVSLIIFLLIFLPMIFVNELSYLSDAGGFQDVENIVEAIAMFLSPTSLPLIIMSITKLSIHNYIGIIVNFIMMTIGLFVILNVAKNRSKKLFWILLLIFILLYMGGLLLVFAGLADSS